MTFGEELVILHTTLSMFGKLLGALLGGSVEVSTMNILYQFIESETHFGMSRGA